MRYTGDSTRPGSWPDEFSSKSSANWTLSALRVKGAGSGETTRRESVKKFLVVALAMVCLIFVRQVANAQDAGINGKWHFVMDTPGGDREMDADFTVAADGKVTGKYGTTDVAGTYKDGKLDLNFSMTSEESGETAPLKLVGKLDETAALVGTWEFSSYNGTFKATRPKS
jgi:hypothetical protein